MDNTEELKSEIIVLKNRVAELEKENEELRKEYNDVLNRLLNDTTKGGYNW